MRGVRNNPHGTRAQTLRLILGAFWKVIFPLTAGARHPLPSFKPRVSFPQDRGQEHAAGVLATQSFHPREGHRRFIQGTTGWNIHSSYVEQDPAVREDNLQSKTNGLFSRETVTPRRRSRQRFYFLLWNAGGRSPARCVPSSSLESLTHKNIWGEKHHHFLPSCLKR